MQHLTRLLGALAAALLLLSAVALVGSPEASAHGAADEYTHDDEFMGSCPSGFTPNGVTVPGGYVGCRPNGKVPLTDAAECATVPGGSFIGGFCTFDGARVCGLYADFIFPIGGGLCVRPVLHDGDDDGARSQGVPTCIEDATAQTYNKDGHVGDVFYGPDGVAYEVVTGAPFCDFNCIFGFDINCDGKIGDFCEAGLNLWKVSDVAICLASTAAE